MAKTNTATAATQDQFEAVIPDNRLSMLAALLLATNSGPEGFAFLSPEDAEGFNKAGFVLVDANTKNEDGQIAVRLNDAGVNYATQHPAEPDHNVIGTHNSGDDGKAGTAEQTQKRKRQATGYERPANIEIDTEVAMPGNMRGRGGDGGYPFDQLQPGHSFHIPATEACPDPSKSVASSVTAANKKYSQVVKNEDGTPKTETKTVKVKGKQVQKEVEVTELTRQFTVRAVDKNDPKGPGCRVWRVK